MSVKVTDGDRTPDTWDQQILRHLPSGVDLTLLSERLALTPTERLERMTAVLRALDEARSDARDNRLSDSR